MKDEFNKYLDEIGEVGYVEEFLRSIVYVSGLPHARISEIVLFEDGAMGQVLSMSQKYVAVLLLSFVPVKVGSKVARTGKLVDIEIGEEILGKAVDPLGHPLDKSKILYKKPERKEIDTKAPGLESRLSSTKPLETGVAIVDLLVPLARGQRELVLGDRKTGKTIFLSQVIKSQAMNGSICIYAACGKRSVDIIKIRQFLKDQKIDSMSIVVASQASDPPGLIFTTPYAAMTIAEYFRDMGKDVLLVLDDLTTHAKAYRELSLLSRKFPGKNSYPGDIFYVHSRLLERAGKFAKGAITCLPVAESVQGDLTGYIQTNLMSITDGHIYFDNDLYNQGRRPAVNPFISVTRVGLQTQSPLLRDLGRTLSTFLVSVDKTRQFMHFGAELSEQLKQSLKLADQIISYFDQEQDRTIPLNINVALVAFLWSGFWREKDIPATKKETRLLVDKYIKEDTYRSEIDKLIESVNSFQDLISQVKQNRDVYDILSK